MTILCYLASDSTPTHYNEFMLKKSSNVGPIDLAIEEDVEVLMSSKLIPVPNSIRHT